jgi:FkbH-like protein
VGSVEYYLRGLELRVTIDPVEDGTMSRVVQLLAKTNQFNLTTRRHDEATIRRRIAAGSWRVYTMKVAERFGDFGLTGAAILEQEADTWHLESFLLSCRVIGKSVETALLARVAEDARAAGASALSAEFIESGRNQVASALLPDHGFARGADGRWHRSLDLPGPEWPAWISPAALQTAGAVLTNSEEHHDA